MVTGEDEMVRAQNKQDEKPEERFTSLQPTYEDSVPPEGDETWQYDDE